MIFKFFQFKTIICSFDELILNQYIVLINSEETKFVHFFSFNQFWSMTNQSMLLGTT